MRNDQGDVVPFNDPAGQSVFMAPENIQGNYGEKVDLWSLGVVLYLLLTNDLPFDGPSEEEIFMRIRLYPPDMKHPQLAKKSLEANDLLKKLLFKDPR